MKLTLPLALIMFGLMSSNGSVYAQAQRPHFARAAVSSYCTEARFQSYIELAASMRDYVTPEEYARLYIPLKVKASKAKITLNNYGALSNKTHKAVMDIVNFVDTNEGSFGSLWEVEAFFNVAQDLMDMTQSLSRDLE